VSGANTSSLHCTPSQDFLGLPHLRYWWQIQIGRRTRGQRRLGPASVSPLPALKGLGGSASTHRNEFATSINFAEEPGHSDEVWFVTLLLRKCPVCNDSVTVVNLIYEQNLV
jgi:hypothetical protein